jgi:hypothetical protein
MASRLSILTERSRIVGKPEEPESSGYLKWHVDEMPPRMRGFTEALSITGWTALTVPHYLTGNHAVVRGFFIAAVALFCVDFAIRLSKIHCY